MAPRRGARYAAPLMDQKQAFWLDASRFSKTAVLEISMLCERGGLDCDIGEQRVEALRRKRLPSTS